jgi:ligand-binding SRPBCC domain-containing protein
MIIETIWSFHMPSSVAKQLTSLVSKGWGQRMELYSARSIETAITSIGLGAPHPNSEVLIKILSYEIKLLLIYLV